MVHHRIRCSPRKLTITYIGRNVHGLGDQGSTSKQPDNDCVLAYADDIAQMATSIEQLQEHMTRWNESFNRYNLNLNLKKTEVLGVSRTEKEAVVTLDEYQLNQVTNLKYLGCITGSKGQIDEEINGIEFQKSVKTLK